MGFSDDGFLLTAKLSWHQMPAMKILKTGFISDREGADVPFIPGTDLSNFYSPSEAEAVVSRNTMSPSNQDWPGRQLFPELFHVAWWCRICCTHLFISNSLQGHVELFPVCNVLYS